LGRVSEPGKSLISTRSDPGHGGKTDDDVEVSADDVDSWGSDFDSGESPRMSRTPDEGEDYYEPVDDQVRP
jgi:hypothetical protein